MSARALALAVCLGLAVGASGSGCRKRGSTDPPAAEGMDKPSPQAPGPAPGPTPAVPPVPIVARPKLPAGWVEFKHPDGAFTVHLPARARPDKGTKPGDLLRPSADGIPRSAYLAESGDLWCWMEVNIFPADQIASVRDKFINTNFLVEASAYPRKQKTAITWLGHPGLEFVAGDDAALKRSLVSRTAFAGTRMLTFHIEGTNGHPTATEQAAYFDSVVLGK